MGLEDDLRLSIRMGLTNGLRLVRDVRRLDEDQRFRDSYRAGGAFFALKDAQRGGLRDRLAPSDRPRSPIPALRKRDARWVKPELVVGVGHLRGAGALRHATVQDLRDA
jgi:hypothetical protein